MEVNLSALRYFTRTFRPIVTRLPTLSSPARYWLPDSPYVYLCMGADLPSPYLFALIYVFIISTDPTPYPTRQPPYMYCSHYIQIEKTDRQPQKPSPRDQHTDPQTTDLATDQFPQSIAPSLEIVPLEFILANAQIQFWFFRRGNFKIGLCGWAKYVVHPTFQFHTISQPHTIFPPQTGGIFFWPTRGDMILGGVKKFQGGRGGKK